MKNAITFIHFQNLLKLPKKILNKKNSQESLRVILTNEIYDEG